MASKHLLSVGGFQVRESTTPAVLKFLERVVETKLQRFVFFANHNFVLRCREFRETILRDERAVVFNDGVGMDVAALLLRGSRLGDNLNGTDLVPAFLREIQRPIRVYLLGSTDSAVRRAARKFSRLPNIEIAGWCDGFSLWHGTEFVLAHIHRHRPDVLLVAMGNPVQERWILEHGSQLRVPLIMGVGALFEWASGQKTRSPQLLRQLRLEWLYRMALEPKRLFRRYTIDFLRFILIVMRERRRRPAPIPVIAADSFGGQATGGVRGR